MLLQELLPQDHSIRGGDKEKKPSEVYETVMGLTGRCIRDGTNRQKQRMIARIRQLTDAPNTERITFSARQQNEGQDPPIISAIVPRQDNEVDSGVSRYTTILKEKGDAMGIIPSYEIQRLTTDTQTPLFKAVVTFQGHKFEGSGRFKQQAKHQASKAACQFLNI